MALSVRFLFVASVGLASSASATASGAAADLSQFDLRNAEAVVRSLQSGIAEDRKRSAHTFLALGEKYRQRAMRDGNWSPAAKAFGESALLYPRAAVLVQYAESSLRAEASKVAALGMEPQLELLKRTVEVYGSALASDNHAPQLTRPQKEQLEQSLECSRRYLSEQKIVEGCSPLRWLGIARKGERRGG